MERDFYLRQLWDSKGSFDLEVMVPSGIRVYGEMCGGPLPAHARSGDAIAIGAYLGGSDQFDLALRRFAHSYAAQNEKDYSMLSRAVKEGRIIAQVGV